LAAVHGQAQGRVVGAPDDLDRVRHVPHRAVVEAPLVGLQLEPAHDFQEGAALVAVFEQVVVGGQLDRRY
jgi:hypothetical protein